MNRWWSQQPEQRYWLEATDREDIGADLHAPELDESGKEFWGYSLFKEASVGDIVLHYDKRPEANGIVGCSVVSGPPTTKPIVWAARGTYAREKGVKPHERPGFVVPISEFKKLSAPVTLAQIRDHEDKLRALTVGLKQQNRKPLYFPFELSKKSPIRLLQAYAFKLPREFLELFPALTAIVHQAPAVIGKVTSASVEAPAILQAVDGPFDITPIAKELNLRAKGHSIGQLQNIRARMKGFSRRSGSKIFSSQTIQPHWAFHHGGRSELQFNIGFETVSGHEVRHGVAFSFELSQTLKKIDVLIPKVRLFNDYIQLYPELYADMRMWHHRDGKRSTDYPPGPIMPELVTPGPFVFLGKRQPVTNFQYETILNDFDRLLPLYQYVESGGREEMSKSRASEGFKFRPGCTDKSSATKATLAERELDISLKHNLLQAALCRRLITEYGLDNVADEHQSGLGTKIDVVVRRGKDEYWYYEIKTASSPRACLREAFGQLLEYAYWPGAREAKRLIICGESPLDENGKSYLSQLKQRFRLPIDYQQIVS
jgi:hypothetical protein